MSSARYLIILYSKGTKGQDYVARVYFLSAGIEFCRSAHDVEAALEVLRHAVSKRVNPIGQRNLQILWDAFTSDCTELMRKSAIELRVELAPLCGKLKNAAELAADRIQALTPKKSVSYSLLASGVGSNGMTSRSSAVTEIS